MVPIYLSHLVFLWVPTLSILRMVPSFSSFDKISSAELHLDKFSDSSTVIFSYFFFNLYLFDAVWFQYSNIPKYL